jgi:hypothetical protein
VAIGSIQHGWESVKQTAVADSMRMGRVSSHKEEVGCRGSDGSNG